MVNNISNEVLEDGLKVLEKSIRAINTNNLLDLERISNEVIHNATVEQDEVSTNISKIIYGIFKLDRHSLNKGIPIPIKDVAKQLIEIHDLLGSGKITAFLKECETIILKIEEIGADIHLYNVIDRAGVKKGGKVYDHGISMGQAAKTMKVSQWELYPYVGSSKLNDYPEDVDKRVKRRIEYTRRLFS